MRPHQPFVSKALLISFLLASKLTVAEMAVLGEPLKERYRTEGLGSFYQTGKKADSYSIICDMGQAVPDPKTAEDWYINKKIPGLGFELRAKAVIERENNTHWAVGFVVIVKNNDILKVFKPLGEYEKGKWTGDAFNSWSGTSTDIRVFSERFGMDGYASFDLMDGMGFYYQYQGQEGPSYFLSNCRRIKKSGLPVYDWNFNVVPQ